jgi:hypothetical protein
MDYALFISLALYGAYTGFAERLPDKEGRWRRVIISLLMAILFYAALKFVFIAAGIQSP